MGFFKSFTRELGRNTGKWVSNKDFKDSWSTPYRFTRTQAKSTGRKSASNAQGTTSRPHASKSSNAQDPLVRQLRELDVPNDAAALTDQLEFLLGVLVEHQEQGDAHKTIRSLAKTKYRLGVHRLANQDAQSARYFKRELRRIRGKAIRKIVLTVVGLILFILLALLLAGG